MADQSSAGDSEMPCERPFDGAGDVDFTSTRPMSKMTARSGALGMMTSSLPVIAGQRQRSPAFSCS